MRPLRFDPEKQKRNAAMTARHADGATYADIAREFGLSYMTVYSALGAMRRVDPQQGVDRPPRGYHFPTLDELRADHARHFGKEGA